MKRSLKTYGHAFWMIVFKVRSLQVWLTTLHTFQCLLLKCLLFNIACRQLIPILLFLPFKFPLQILSRSKSTHPILCILLVLCRLEPAYSTLGHCWYVPIILIAAMIIKRLFLRTVTWILRMIQSRFAFNSSNTVLLILGYYPSAFLVSWGQYFPIDLDLLKCVSIGFFIYVFVLVLMNLFWGLDH